MGVGRSVHSVSYIDFGAQGGICQNCHHIIASQSIVKRLRQMERHQWKFSSILPIQPSPIIKQAEWRRGGVDLDVVYVLYFVCVVFLCCAFVITLLIFSSVRQC